MQLGSGRRGSSSFKLGVPSKFNALVLGFLISAPFFFFSSSQPLTPKHKSYLLHTFLPYHFFGGS